MGIAFGLAFLPVVFMGPIALVFAVSVTIAVAVIAIGLGMAFDWSLFIATDEDRTAVAAVREGISRAMRRGRFWRTIGITLALAALELIVGFVINVAVSSVFVWAKSALLYTALMYVFSLPFYAYSGLVVAIYFLDSRLRDTALASQPVR